MNTIERVYEVNTVCRLCGEPGTEERPLHAVDVLERGYEDDYVVVVVPMHQGCWRGIPEPKVWFHEVTVH